MNRRSFVARITAFAAAIGLAGKSLLASPEAEFVGFPEVSFDSKSGRRYIFALDFDRKTSWVVWVTRTEVVDGSKHIHGWFGSPDSKRYADCEYEAETGWVMRSRSAETSKTLMRLEEDLQHGGSCKATLLSRTDIDSYTEAGEVVVWQPDGSIVGDDFSACAGSRGVVQFIPDTRRWEIMWLEC